MAFSRRGSISCACTVLLAALAVLALLPGRAVANSVEASPAVRVQQVRVQALAWENSADVSRETEGMELPRFSPVLLSFACDPSAAQVGVDCGMEWMCGLDPCLCGSADAWGGCSCNGLQTVEAQVVCRSSDEDVVKVRVAFGRLWAVPQSEGEATLVCEATLPHHDSVIWEVPVAVGKAVTGDFALAAALLALLATAGVGVALLLGGCGAVRVGEGSPRVEKVELRSASAMTEESQTVEVRLVFDKPLLVSGAVDGDFVLLLNGAPVAEDAVVVDVRASAQAVTFSLRPASAARQAQGSALFALYQAEFSVTSVRKDGALPSLTAASGECAVLEEPVSGVLPSGLSLEIVEVREGNADEGVAARTTVRVTSPACVRSITWLSLSEEDGLLLKHNHDFASATTADAAADIAQVVNAAGADVVASAQGDCVVLTAARARDGQIIELSVVEGAGASAGSYDAHADGRGEA